MVSVLGQNFTSAHTMVSDIHRTIVQDQEVNGGKPSVSDVRIPPVAEWPLIVPQTQARLVI